MRDARKLTADDVKEVEDFGILAPLEDIFEAYIPYRDKGILPYAGGSLDQDPNIMYSLQIVDLMVAYFLQRVDEPDRPKPPKFEDS